MPEPEYYKMRVVRNGKIEEFFFEINGDKRVILLCKPDENISYADSTIEKIIKEEIEKELSKDLNYHPAS